MEEPSLMSSDSDSGSQSFASRAERAKIYLSCFFQLKDSEPMDTSPQDANREAAVMQVETTNSSTPMSLMDAITLRGHSSGSTTTTTTIAPGSSSKKNNHGLDLLDPRQIAEKSQVDRQKARDAIILLDRDVALLQRLLQEKDDALRSAEARASEFQQVTIHTEILKQEVHGLEITIHDLHKDLEAKEKTLKESQKKNTKDQKRSEAQLKELEQEISKLNTDLIAKEQVQFEAEVVQKRLDEANSQRATLIVEIHELSAALKDCEAELEDAQTTIKYLEENNHAYSEETVKVKSELALREVELKDCRQKIDTLEEAREKVHSLEQQIETTRGQLSSSEARLKDLKKTNRTLSDDRARAEKLELEGLRNQVSIQEKHLAYLENALQAHENCTFEVQRADNLQNELKDLRNPSDIQEKHLVYLEGALQSHESCAFDAQQLRGSIDALKALLEKRESLLEEANVVLHDRESNIEALKTEIRTILDEAQAKDEAAQLIRGKSAEDLARVSSTASILKTEVESLHVQLKEKSFALAKAEKDAEDLGEEKNKTMQLEAEIKRLENVIADKDQHGIYLDMIVENMRERLQSSERLEGQVEKLQNEKVHAEAAANRSAKDLSAVSTTASKLVVEVEYLREQLMQKGNELVEASKASESLVLKSDQIKQLLVKIASLEESSESNLRNSQLADKRVEDLEAEIKAMETRLGALQSQFKSKEANLQAVLNKANQDHEATAKHLEESRSKISDLTTQLKETEKETKSQINAKQEQIRELLQDMEKWEYHEEGWVNKATDQNYEIGRLNKAVNIARTELRDNRKKQTQELQEELDRWEKHEEGWIVKIGRLNEAVNVARTELREDRKRRASEVEEKVIERTRDLQNDKSTLKRSVSELEDHIFHLQKKIRLDNDQMVGELELTEKIRELTYWKQTSMEQTKEWETTVSNLQDEKEQQVALLTRYEHQIQLLKTKLTIEKAEKMTKRIVKLEKELVKLKGIILNSDSNNTELKERVDSLTEQIEALELQREDLSREARAKSTQIVELEEHLREEVASYKTRFADARRELELKDRKLSILNLRIMEHARPRVSSDKRTLLALESALIKLRNSLAAQVAKYKVLDKKHKAVLVEQVNRDMQLDQLERYLARVYNEDTENLQGLLCKEYRLEEKLKEALQRTSELQIEVHNITCTYQLTLTQLKNTEVKMTKMVPIEEVNHTSCALRVQAGEREGARLSERIGELTETIRRISKDHSRRESEWAHTEEGYGDRIELLVKNQAVLESQLQDTNKAREQERVEREQDRVRAESERERLEETIRSLKRGNMEKSGAKRVLI
ncbi:hypothetical protein BGX26_009705 [Mortierella sp. AD094]|nr:hypothetical protein BGX26_009705 [Mortierella sp. AD094]